jgi:neutral trehalase
MDRLAQKHQADEIATRLEAGESVTALAAEYGLSRITVWRRGNQGIAARMPGMDDRDEARAEITAILWTEIMEATQTNDRKALVPLLDRYARMNGLDHSHRVEEAKLQLDAVRVKLLSDAMTNALEQAEVSIPQRRKVLELIANAGK